MRLSNPSLSHLGSAIDQPTYDRAQQKVGIVHFGIGAFHRAHQAVYTDDAMGRGERDWRIIGVSLRSEMVANQMNPQDGLYTLVTRSEAPERLRVIGAVAGVLNAPRQTQEVVDVLAAPSTSILSFTVTEKGYCRTADGNLDPELAGPHSLYPLLHAGLAKRKTDGGSGLTLMSCDNLANNSQQLAHLLNTYLDHRDPALARWVQDHCRFPSTMVDRIVPATTPDDLDRVAQALGLRDEAAVLTEPFTQWVIEDDFAGPRPQWERSGAQLVQEAAPWEAAKLRLLNGAHSALAYLGLERGYSHVHQAIADPQLRALVYRLMLDEAAPTLPPMSGFNAHDYADDLLARFANPTLQHRLQQIAMDGSQKITQRWLQSLTINQQAGRSSPALLSALAAWVRHSQGANGPVDDPKAQQFADLWKGQDLDQGLMALFGPRESALVGPLAPDLIQQLRTRLADGAFGNSSLENQIN